jgi:outer membrane protein assembly factor BamD (BamD/ComL family)
MRKYVIPFVLLASSLFSLEERDLVFEDQTSSVTEYNSLLQEALASSNWWAVVDCADMISYNFPTTPFAQESPYLTGYAYFQMGQFELANQALSSYINHSATHSHFEEAIQIKFEIAEAFQNGKKKRLFGSHKMPAWLSAKENALEIYDEVITVVPHSAIAAKALLGKAKIQAEFEDYKDSIETLAQLIRKFPKSEEAAEAYLEVNRVYLTQCKTTSLDLDLLDLAAVNLRKFHSAFPREERLDQADKLFRDTQELFAQNLFETGQFFERTKKSSASKIYFDKVISKYPSTEAAKLAREKVNATR